MGCEKGAVSACGQCTAPIKAGFHLTDLLTLHSVPALTPITNIYENHEKVERNGLQKTTPANRCVFVGYEPSYVW